MNRENPPVEKPATETPASTASTPTTPKKRSGWLPAFVLSGVFLVGFVPMWLKSTRLNGELFLLDQQAGESATAKPGGAAGSHA